MTLLLPLLLALAQADKPAEGHPVAFKPGAADSPLAPRFSPKGTQVKLTPTALPGLAGNDHLAGRIPVGPAATRGDGVLVAVGRSEAGKPYDLLFIDANRNGSLADEKPVTTKPSVVRDKWWSSFSATLRVDHASKGAPPAVADYPVSLWVVVDKPADRPDVVRYSRKGFLAGSVKVGGVAYDVGVTDMDNDGLFGPGDSWVIVPAGGAKGPAIGDWRKVTDFAWGGEKAWKLSLEGTSGASGRIVAHDPGITRADDETARDKLRVDRTAPRAAKPVPFRSDADAAVKEAVAAKKPYLLKFETDWCGPCKQMHAYVFTAKEVADAASGVTCVTVDGDKRKDLVKTHKVGGYPTCILFGPDNKELGRLMGYQGVKDMAKFLRRAKE